MNNLDDKLSKLSDEALLKNEKTLKIVSGLLFGCIVLLFVLVFVIIRKKGFTPLFVLPFSLLAILLPNITNLKAVQKEKRARGL